MYIYSFRRFSEITLVAGRFRDTSCFSRLFCRLFRTRGCRVRVRHLSAGCISRNGSTWGKARSSCIASPRPIPKLQKHTVSLKRPKYHCVPLFPFPSHTHISPVLPSLGLCLDVRGYCSRRFHVQSCGHVFQVLIKLYDQKSLNTNSNWGEGALILHLKEHPNPL